jgi:ribosomal-protein-alanine N-acetyltransferase
MDRDLLVGYIIYSEVVDELHILNVATDPHYRRKGIATAMLLYLHQAALRRGRKVAFLEVRRSNLTAQQLYAKFGYRPVGKRTDYYSDTHEDAIIMTADLRKEKA